MIPPVRLWLEGSRGRLIVHTWPSEKPRSVVLLPHAFGHLASRYAGLIERLVAGGSVVYAPQPAARTAANGAGGPVFDVEELASDLQTVAAQIRQDYPELPMYLLG